MKKILAFLGCIAISGLVFVTPNIDGSARSWVSGVVNVSTDTVTPLKVDTYNLAGRYEIRIQNPSVIYSVAIDTSPAMTYATAGWILRHSSGTRLANDGITLPLNAGTTVYALGEAQQDAATVAVKIIELK